MLCPNCGVEVGAALKLCTECEERKALLKQQEEEESQEHSSRKSGRRRASNPPRRSSAPEIDLPHEDGLVHFFNFMASPIGVGLCCTIIYLIIFLGIVLFLPGKGLIGSGLLALIVTGIGCGCAAPYAFAFDESGKRKYTGIVLGWMVSGIGLGLYSLHTGENVLKIWDEVHSAVFDSKYEAGEYEDYQMSYE